MEKKRLGRLVELMSWKKATDEEGFSLLSREGADAVTNLARLATGQVRLDQLDHKTRYGFDADGTLRLDVDEETFELLNSGRR